MQRWGNKSGSFSSFHFLNWENIDEMKQWENIDEMKQAALLISYSCKRLLAPLKKKILEGEVEEEFLRFVGSKYNNITDNNIITLHKK